MLGCVPSRDVFPEPHPLKTAAAKLPGTDGRKMSKSYGNSILISDPEAEVRKKLKTMVTDPARIRRTDVGNPDICPVGDLHKIFSSAETMAEVRQGCTTAGIGCIQCKGWVADNIVAMLNPIQERRRTLREQSPARLGYSRSRLGARPQGRRPDPGRGARVHGHVARSIRHRGDDRGVEG